MMTTLLLVAIHGGNAITVVSNGPMQIFAVIWPFGCKLYVGTIDRRFVLGTGTGRKNAVTDRNRERSTGWDKESAHTLSVINFKTCAHTFRGIIFLENAHYTR